MEAGASHHGRQVPQLRSRAARPQGTAPLREVSASARQDAKSRTNQKGMQIFLYKWENCLKKKLI